MQAEEKQVTAAVGRRIGKSDLAHTMQFIKLGSSSAKLYALMAEPGKRKV